MESAVSMSDAATLSTARKGQKTSPAEHLIEARMASFGVCRWWVKSQCSRWKRDRTAYRVRLTGGGIHRSSFYREKKITHKTNK
jgi:hypothetical protein